MPIARALGCAAMLAANTAWAQQAVTPDTFTRAETDRMFQDIAGGAGGVNRFLFYRTPTPLDHQTVVRMNRDTLYTGMIVDTAGGATITIPELPEGRYASVLVIDNDHYAPTVFYEPGVHEIPADTRYMFLALRIQLFDPDDPAEVALVNDLQDQFVVAAASAEPLPPFGWETASLDDLRAQYEKDSAAFPSWKGMMGPRGQVDEETRHVAAAAAWGLFPEWDATYLNYNDPGDPSVCQTATFQIPENDAFWSITVYGSDGFIKSDASTIRSVNAAMNPDGTFTAFFGSKDLCGDVPNRVDTPDGWNFLMRIYRPGPSVVAGSYTLPDVVPVN